MLYNLRKILLIKGIEIIPCRNIFEMLNKFMKELMVFLFELIFKSFKDFEYKETNLFFNYQ